MELNRLIDKKLTSEQKRKFEQNNGKFKIIDILIILPIITTLLGIFLESIIVVSASIVCIIIFLLIIAFSTKKKNVIYEDVIIPLVLQERFRNIESVLKDDGVEKEFIMSGLGRNYSKFESRNYLRLHEDRYFIELSKIITRNKKIQEDEVEEDREFEKTFSGMFAYVKLPNSIDVELEVKENIKSVEQVNNIDKADVHIVKMNNMDFDTQYDVMATDPLLARKVLSIGVMARILEINRKLGKVINFSIKNNMLYVLIEYDEFLEFNSTKKNEYINEVAANDNMDAIEVLDYFVRYIVNLTEI